VTPQPVQAALGDDVPQDHVRVAPARGQHRPCGVDGWVGWMCGCVGWMCGCVDGWMDEWVGGWMDGWVGGWMSEWMGGSMCT
jgi:hypothetical protein